MSFFLNFAAINITAKAASLFFTVKGNMGHGSRASTWFMVTAQTTNTVLSYNKATDSGKTWTTVMASSDSAGHLHGGHHMASACSIDHGHLYGLWRLTLSETSTQTPDATGLWTQTWPLVAA